MKGSVVTLSILLVLSFVCLASSQITFSRSWVRGKYPGEDPGELVGDGDGSFLRAAKAEDNSATMYNRVPKSPLTVNLNYRLLQDIFRKWKSQNYNRYKDYPIPYGE